jgi:hypothetical protein
VLLVELALKAKQSRGAHLAREQLAVSPPDTPVHLRDERPDPFPAPLTPRLLRHPAPSSRSWNARSPATVRTFAVVRDGLLTHQGSWPDSALHSGQRRGSLRTGFSGTVLASPTRSSRDSSLPFVLVPRNP